MRRSLSDELGEGLQAGLRGGLNAPLGDRNAYVGYSPQLR